MDNISHSRVLEAIDPNTLSLISSSSGSNLCSSIHDGLSESSFGRPASPSIVDNEGALAAKWQFDRKEFEFESNSTPTKNNDPGHQKMLHVRKRRSQLMGAKPRVSSKLYQSTSKLDLLDEKKLTSFPIPPPRSLGATQNVKRLKLNPINEIRIHNDKTNRRISYGLPQKALKTEEEEHDNEHPIVLVEDYIPFDEANERYFAKKRVSISNLRTKMSKRCDMHVPLRLKNLSKQDQCKTPSSSVTLVPHILDDNFAHEDSACSLQEHDSQTLHLNNDENVPQSFQHILDDLIKPEISDDNDEYLSDLRINSRLKKCVVCEKPLYEISSIMSETDDFKEIVCGKCTARYEEAAKFFENYEFESSGESSNDTTMSSMDSAIELSSVEEWQAEAPQNRMGLGRQHTNRFSKELIKRLQVQSNIGLNKERHSRRKELLDCGTILWFMEAKRKITRFLTKKYDTNVSSNS